ncbi:hypothetical protein IAT38_008342 [Cryptococcus sp. DSM 104549]
MPRRPPHFFLPDPRPSATPSPTTLRPHDLAMSRQVSHHSGHSYLGPNPGAGGGVALAGGQGSRGASSAALRGALQAYEVSGEHEARGRDVGTESVEMDVGMGVESGTSSPPEWSLDAQPHRHRHSGRGHYHPQAQGYNHGPPYPDSYFPASAPHTHSHPLQPPLSISSALNFSHTSLPHTPSHQRSLAYTFDEGPSPTLERLEMDALVEIHRILYRGREDMEMLAARGEEMGGWEDEAGEVRRVVERWFEGDCVYDHPLLRVTSRRALLTHFILLHLLSTAYLPSLTPSALLLHARHLTSGLRNRLMGLEEPRPGGGKVSGLGEEEEWLGLPQRGETAGKRETGTGERKEGWWRLWEVTADCREIGEMECYDGVRLAMIDHVISLTFLPALSTRHLYTPSASYLSFPDASTTASFTQPNTTPSLFAPSPASLPGGPHSALASTRAPSFTRRLAACLLSEFEGVLHWDLPMTTMVQFNEVGKATHVRDVIDLRDALETFIPFAKRIGWLTRHLSGMVSSALGEMVLGCVGGVNVVASREEDRRAAAVPAGYPGGEIGGVGMEKERHPLASPRAASTSKDPLGVSERAVDVGLPMPAMGGVNSLGLENVGVPGPVVSMAPDVDMEGL